MVWLVINGRSNLYGSMEDGLAALTQVLAHRRGLGCAIVPNDPPTFGVEYRADHPDGGGFELIYLSDEEPGEAQ